MTYGIAMRGLCFLLALWMASPLPGLAGGFLAPGEAREAGENVIGVSYGVYAGGFRALDISLRLESGQGRYAVRMKAVPYGVIGSLLPWAGEYATNGRLGDAGTMPRLVPETHSKISRWREDNDQDYFTYKDGVLAAHRRISLDGNRQREENRPLDPEFHADSVDLLTAVMQMLAQVNVNGQDGACAASPVVFDGKRRFRLKFTAKGRETLVKSAYNMASGEAHVCEIEMVPLKGFGDTRKGYYKIQEEARKRGQLPRVWLARLWADGPYLPVKLLVKSEYGAVFAHAQKASH